MSTTVVQDTAAQGTYIWYDKKQESGLRLDLFFVFLPSLFLFEFVTTSEPSHGRGAPEVPEPLTLGAQYLTRYNTWNNSFEPPDRHWYALVL